LDNAQFGKQHIRAILVAGTGFLTDSYDNFVIGLMVSMIGFVYFDQTTGKMPDGYSSTIKAASSWGNLVGQFAFGMMGDVFGRKKMYGVELIILIVGALGCALVPGSWIVVLMVFWRFVLGVGVGGDYPVSGVIASEFASQQHRGMMIATVFAMQGVGIVIGSLVAIVALSAAQSQVQQDPKQLDYVWRFMAAFGIIPALSAVYYRLTIPETPRYALHVEGSASKSARAAQQYLNQDQSTDIQESTQKPTVTGFLTKFYKHFEDWENRKILIATSMCWFLLDIGYYGTNLNTPTILNAFGYTNDQNASVFDRVWTTAVGTTIVNLAGNFPGYWFTVYYIDRIGRKPIQLTGFAVLAVCFFLLGAFYDYLRSKAVIFFVLIYCTAQFFFNFGPNTTTFVIPAEVFPTHVRSSAHGISAACGKLGAILAAQIFDPIKSLTILGIPGIKILLFLFSLCCVGGFYFTHWIPETMGKSLEELSGQESIPMDVVLDESTHRLLH
ncbi:major facilitator superfamily domain-containing protein, partial [Gorgonomyces haynaldii]